MPDVYIAMIDQGLNALLPINQLNPREAADGSKNVFYEKGIARTAPGYADWHTPTGLTAGGDAITAFFTCTINNNDFLLALTRKQIMRRDFINSEWDDITQSGVQLDSDIDHPVSWVVISHDDSDIYFNDNTLQAHAYEHVIICDGGLSNIQRWAGEGETDCADLVGAGGYSGETRHRALQVGTFQNRLILVSPFEYDASSRVWVENRPRVRWPAIGKLQTYSGTGAGAVDLRDTGGINVWSGPLAGEYYIYQNNSIWNLRYVGSTTVFDPRPVVHDLGLLSHHLLAPHGNVHYFVGSDYNVYAYYGGTIKQAIGDKIKDYLYRDIERTHLKRCWMTLDVNAERLGIFFVPTGGMYPTKAYWYDLLQGSWMLADYSDDTSHMATGGITAVGVLGTITGTTGDTYTRVLTHLSPYDISDAGDATKRYGDALCELSRTLTSEVSNATWCAGGAYLACATGAFLTDMTVGDIVLVEDGSGYTGCRYGCHYYSIQDMSNTYLALNERDSSCAVAPDATTTPAGVPFTVWTDGGNSYAQALQVYQTRESLLIGTNSANLMAVEQTLSGSLAGSDVQAQHVTPILDGGTPGRNKRWPGLRVTAKSQTSGQPTQINVYYRTSHFDASSGWVRCDTTWTLDGTWAVKTAWINRTAAQIQFALMDSSGSAWEVREIEILSPVLEGNR